MKKEKITNFFSKFSFFKKYNYDVNRVVGIKGDERYVLLAEKKLIRIYRGKLKSTPLLCSYIPIENAIFYSFDVEANVIENVDLDSFIETKVYEEAGLLETEEYIVKYEIVKSLKDEKKVVIQCVIVPVNFVTKNYEYILKETGYIDYLSFPAFAYKSLYKENILKKGNDLFVVMLYDKVFFTFYSEGELLYINTVTGGLNKIYESLKSLKIANFDFNLFKKLLTKKGIDRSKYIPSEIPVLDTVESDFQSFAKIIQEQILGLINNYDVDDVDRIFITTEYGDIPGIKDMFEYQLQKKVLGFEFYEEYNLDLLPIDPFLFLGMLETHDAYKFNDFSHNFSLFLRKPTFFYRPSGLIILTFIISVIILSAYPLYLIINGLIYNNKSEKLEKEFQKISIKKNTLIKQINILKNKVLVLKKKADVISKEINENKKLIETLYKFKFSYLPKSQELVDITKIMNKYKIYLINMEYTDGVYNLKIYSYNDANIGKFIDDLINSGFNVSFENIKNKNGKYYTLIRIEE